MNTALFTALAAALATTAAAQATWIVDAAGAPGTDFTDLPPAVAAASHGDTVLVRRGFYAATTTHKGLRILGDVGAQVSVCVTGLPAGQEFVAERLSGPLWLVGNAGYVHVAEIQAPFAIIADCELVTMNRSSFGPAGFFGPLTISGSTVVLTGCSATSGVSGVAALSSYDSKVTIAGGCYLGVAAWCDFAYVALSPGIYASGGQLRVTGDGVSIRAGAGHYLCASQPPTPAIRADGTEIEIDPSVSLSWTYGPPAISGGAVASKRVLGVLGYADPPGGSLHVDVFAPAGNSIALLVSRPATPTVFPPFGILWFDVPTVFSVPLGAVPTSEHLLVDFGIPPGAIAPGEARSLQAATIEGAEVLLSTPLIVVFH